MPAQQQELKKNYIGIVSDKTEEQRAVELLPKPDRPAKQYLLSLMASVLHRDVEALDVVAQPGKASGRCLISPDLLPVSV